MRIVLRYFGFLLVISAFFRVLPVLIGLIYNESVGGFIFTFFGSLFAGLALLYIFRGEKGKIITATEGFILAALSFVVLPAVGAISFLPYVGYNPIDAYFEAISGLTTTGLSLISSLDELPKSVLMWRSEMQWMGGLGIITFFLFLLTRFTTESESDLEELQKTTKSKLALYQSQGFDQKFEGGLKGTLNKIILIYLIYTLIGIILLAIVGLPMFEAIAISFAAISTGGFSVTDAFYSSGPVLGVIGFIMILGSISFVSHNLLLRGKIKEFLKSYEKNVFLAMLIFSIAATLIVFSDLKVVFFEIVSAFTTTGFSLTDVNIMPSLLVFIIFVGMLIGGTTVSTSGGIKVKRIYTLLKTIPWIIKKKLSPANSIIPLKVHDETVDRDKLIDISVFVYTYFLIIIIGGVLFMLHGYSFMDAFFQMISALSTVGLQSMDLISISPLLKSVLMIAMVFGRLEIFPLLVLLRKVVKPVK